MKMKALAKATTKNTMTDQEGKELQRATLADLIERAVPYERWRAPLDQRLQLLSWLSGASLLTHLLFVSLLPQLLAWSRSGYFLILGEALYGLLSWISAHMPLLLGLNMAALAIYFALLWRTQSLQTGTLVWQRVAFGEVVAGAVGTFPLAVNLAIALVNLALWIVIIIVAIVVGTLITIAAFWILGAFLGAAFES